MLDEALAILRKTLASGFAARGIDASFSWPISGRAVSEIGGRLIEDFVLESIEELIRQFHRPTFDDVQIYVPSTGKTMEDFSLRFRRGNEEVLLQIDVKGHNELRKGSRPNLASIRKCIELYDDPVRFNEELVIFFCRYRPSIQPRERAKRLTLEVLEDSFSERGVFALRHLSGRNLDPANIGSGGQLLLAREDNILLEERTRAEFTALLAKYQKSLRIRKG